MTRSNRAADFIKNMTQDAPAPTSSPSSRPVEPMNEPAQQRTTVRKHQKHIGGYFDEDGETVERVALLRVRLKLDNSELIKLAIDELYSKHMAKRAFGDA
jgi:hypothetical protein